MRVYLLLRKTFCQVCISLIITAIGFSQNSYGFYSGLNNSGFHILTKESDDPKLISSQRGTGMQAGAFIFISVEKSFAVQLDLRYMKRTAKADLVSYWHRAPNLKEYGTYHFNFLSLAWKFNRKIAKIKGLYIFTGFDFSSCIFMKAKGDFIIYHLPYGPPDENNGFTIKNPESIGIGIFGGIRYIYKPKAYTFFSLFAESGYYYNLLPNYYELHLHGAEMNLGIMFKLPSAIENYLKSIN